MDSNAIGCKRFRAVQTPSPSCMGKCEPFTLFEKRGNLTSRTRVASVRCPRGNRCDFTIQHEGHPILETRGKQGATHIPAERRGTHILRGAGDSVAAELCVSPAISESIPASPPSDPPRALETGDASAGCSATSPDFAIGNESESLSPEGQAVAAFSPGAQQACRSGCS